VTRSLQFFGLRRPAAAGDDASRIRPSLHPPVGRPHLVKDLERDPPVGDVGRDCLGAMFVLLRAATDHGPRARLARRSRRSLTPRHARWWAPLLAVATARARPHGHRRIRYCVDTPASALVSLRQLPLLWALPHVPQFFCLVRTRLTNRSVTLTCGPE
jgi:hypothetical protein